MKSVMQSVSWLQQSSAILNNVMQNRQQLDQHIGSLVVANDLGNAKQQAQIQTNIEQLREQNNKLESIIYKRTGKNTLEDAIALIEDIRIRLEQANNAFGQWRKTVVSADYLRFRGEVITEEAKTGGAQGATEAQLTDAISNIEAEYVGAVDFLEAAIPQERLLVLA